MAKYWLTPPQLYKSLDNEFHFEMDVADHDNILDAALANDADLPFACKGGVCCTCRAKVIEGKVEMKLNYVGKHQAAVSQTMAILSVDQTLRKVLMMVIADWYYDMMIVLLGGFKFMCQRPHN